MKYYLKNVQMPYCNDADLKTIHATSASIYDDMQTVERQSYVLGVVQALRTSCASLCQWMDSVIKYF